MCKVNELTLEPPLLLREWASRSARRGSPYGKGGELQKAAACYQQGKNQARRFLWVIMVLVLCGILSGQSHFQPVDTTGLPYVIVITGVDVFGQDLAAGDEIAVFDGELCVGADIFDGQYNYQFSAWQENADYGLSGFTPGDSMAFSIWTMVDGQWRELSCAAEFQVGDGTFGHGAYAVAYLSAQAIAVSHGMNPQPEFFHLGLPFPNPFNSTVTLNYRIARAEHAQLTILALTGEEVYRMSLAGSGKFRWDGSTSSGYHVASGSYVAVLRWRNKWITRLLTLVK